MPLNFYGVEMHSTRKRQDQQTAFLKDFQKSHNIENSAKAIGSSKNSIHRWMKDEPTFKDRVDCLRREAKEGKETKPIADVELCKENEFTEGEEIQPYRDEKCVGYFHCLKTQALLGSKGVPMECLKCPNRIHAKPKGIDSDEYYTEVWADAENCCRLLLAVFEPELYFHSHDIRKAIDQPEVELDAPLASVEWF